MRTSELRNILESGPTEVEDFGLYLAYPDTVATDNADELLAPIGAMEVDEAGQQVRLYPPFSAKWSEESVPVESVADLLKSLPSGLLPGYDPELLAELPLVREEGALVLTRQVPVVEVHIGSKALEVWLLLRPATEFAPGTLVE